MDYILYFFITLILSTFFALAGVGSAVALVPILNMLGIPFNLAKASALFVNTSTTIMATIMNIKRKVLDFKFAFPLVITTMSFSPIGAYMSNHIDENYAKMGLIVFLLFSGSMMLFSKKEAKYHYDKKWILYVIGSVVGFISGILGVGGGSLIMPIMILLGFDVKKVAITMSFVVPFSTFTAFLSYTTFIQIDWNLILVTAIAAVIGGFVGNKIMHFKLDSSQIKKIIAILLYIIAVKMIFDLI
jgi:uncharacterized membrane protein YfcA